MARYLAKNIDFISWGSERVSGPLSGFPCAKALARIGPSAWPDMAAELERGDPLHFSDQKIKLHAWVLISCYRYAGEVGAVEDAITAVKRLAVVPWRKKNFERVEKVLNQILQIYKKGKRSEEDRKVLTSLWPLTIKDSPDPK